MERHGPAPRRHRTGPWGAQRRNSLPPRCVTVPLAGRYLPANVLDLADEFRALVAALDTAGIDFAVCGGLAVAIHAEPRATMDIDLLLPRELIDATKEVVRGLGYKIEAGPMVVRPGVVEMHRMSKPDEESGDLLSIDFLLVTPELEPVWASRERIGWEHGELPVVSRKGLIQMKRLRGSGQDLDDIRALGEDGDGEA